MLQAHAHALAGTCIDFQERSRLQNNALLCVHETTNNTCTSCPENSHSELPVLLYSIVSQSTTTIYPPHSHERPAAHRLPTSSTKISRPTGLRLVTSEQRRVVHGRFCSLLSIILLHASGDEEGASRPWPRMPVASHTTHQMSRQQEEIPALRGRASARDSSQHWKVKWPNLACGRAYIGALIDCRRCCDDMKI